MILDVNDPILLGSQDSLILLCGDVPSYTLWLIVLSPSLFHKNTCDFGLQRSFEGAFPLIKGEFFRISFFCSIGLS